MEVTIKKCDRCKKEVGGLIDYSFVNRNMPIKIEEESEKSMFNLMWGGSDKKYPTVTGGLCDNCIQEISRWLGHQENSLKQKVEST